MLFNEVKNKQFRIDSIYEAKGLIYQGLGIPEFLSRNNFVSCGSQYILYFFDMLLVAGFHLKAQVTAIDVRSVAYPFVEDRHHVCPGTGDDFGYML